jgi:hypothetical protein
MPSIVSHPRASTAVRKTCRRASCETYANFYVTVFSM